MVRSTQSRDWCFTVNNYEHVPQELPPRATYLVYGKEVGESGTPHLQGFVQFERKVAFTTVQKWLKAKAHCEQRRGTPLQAADYCKKDGDFEEFGVLSDKTDPNISLSELSIMAADMTYTMRDLFELNPSAYMRYGRHLHSIRLQFCKPPTTRPMLVQVYYGPPGTGKSYAAFHENPVHYATPISGNGNVWFDGYDSEKTVILEDFSGQLPLVQLLRLLDVYPVQVPVKLGHAWFFAEKIIITTNVHPMHWYDYEKRKDSWKALSRRINVFVCFVDKDHQFIGDIENDPNPEKCKPDLYKILNINAKNNFALR